MLGNTKASAPIWTRHLTSSCDTQSPWKTLGDGEYGLFVNLGSFARGAVELERNRAKLRLINGEQFVELIFEHYAQLAPRYRSMIPLKQIFVPDLPQD